MRITFVTAFLGLAGGNRVIAAYAREFVRQGHEVTVVSAAPHRYFSRRRRLKFWLGLERRPPEPIMMPWLTFLGDRHVHTASSERITADEVPDADVVIATWWETAEWVAAFPASKGRKFYLLQDYEIFNPRSAERVAATYAMDMHKIAVSHYIRKTIEENHDVSGKISVVPNAVDHVQFDAPPRDRSDDMTVGFILSYEPRKNVGLAFEALERARAQYPELRALAFGRDRLRADPPLPDWIEFTHAPAQEDIPGLYAACDLWLFPTRREGFGLPLLEAMACRTPVVATDAGAAPDLVNGQNGDILPHDPDAFAQAILRFRDMSQAEWRTYSNAAHAAAQEHTWAHAGDRFLKVLEENLSN